MPQLDWASLLELFDCTTTQPNLQLDVTIATVFEQRYAIRVVQLCLWEARCKAVVQLCEVTIIDQVLPCPADSAMGIANPAIYYALSLWQTLGAHEAALLGWATPLLDDQPCTWCGQDYGVPSMVLCDWCSHYYHRYCAA